MPQDFSTAHKNAVQVVITRQQEMWEKCSPQLLRLKCPNFVYLYFTDNLDLINEFISGIEHRLSVFGEGYFFCTLYLYNVMCCSLYH